MLARIAKCLLTCALCAGAALFAAAPATALKMSTCKADREFVCGTLRVPLDHSGRVRGSLSLEVAAQREYADDAGLLIALSGGPGQSSVDAAGAFALSLGPMLNKYRLVVLDQRGTGAGALQCPELQRIGALQPFTSSAVLRCAKRIGPRRRFFSTADTVDDLDDLRRAFGARKAALMGISYGTWVAMEYARAHPKRTDRLLLDSVVGPDVGEGFQLDTYSHLPRVLREQCARSMCKGATKHPVADLAKVAARLRRGPISGTRLDAEGRRRAAALRSEAALAFMVQGGDLNPFMQARLPGVLAAASEGDYAPLLRLLPVAEGPPTPTDELSVGLNVVTGCLDGALPYPLNAAPAERSAMLSRALAAVPPSAYDPWSVEAIRRTSVAGDCLMFPRQAAPAAAKSPLPDVPTLILSGRLDMRTPAENGRATARLSNARASSSCAATGTTRSTATRPAASRARVSRWVNRERFGTPCADKSNQVDVIPQPPRKLSEFKSSKQVPGRRGSVVLAAMETASELRFTAIEAVFAGLDPRGGGLRGGSYAASDAVRGRRHAARLRVRARRAAERPHHARLPARHRRRSGERHDRRSLHIDTRKGASGVLGGKPVRYRRQRAGAASLRRGFPEIAPALLERAALRERLAPPAAR